MEGRELPLSKDPAGFFETAALALRWMGLDGTILRANQAELDLLGYAPEEYVGHGIDEFHVAPEAALELLQRLRTGETPCRSETQLRCKDGTIRTVLVLCQTICQEGQSPRVCCFTQDITDSHKQKEQWRQQAEEQTEANRQKNQFLTLLTHEMRNQFAPLSNALHIFKMPQAEPRTIEMARSVMERQLGKLIGITDDLLDVARLLQGDLTLRREQVDLKQLVQATVDRRRLPLEQEGPLVTLAVPETPAWALADPRRLTQVLEILLDNAARSSGRGGQVSVRLETDSEKGQAILSVRDTGRGIDPVMLPLLFDTFGQVEKRLQRGRGGLGLGLTLVHGLVSLHGGEVSAHNAGPDHGAEFIVRLPLQKEPAVLAGAPETASPPARGLRVLVIEDNQDSANSLRILLEMYGHQVVVAYTGLEGVRAAHECRPDVVLCDIGLPGLDGYGVARQLRSNPATATARLIAVTGYGSEEDRRRALASGFDFHLTKPADPGRIRQLLQRN
jgi:PAS domain S-box-containing protein